MHLFFSFGLYDDAACIRQRKGHSCVRVFRLSAVLSAACKMICTDKDDKAFVLIDFTYQKDGRSYVTDSYVNFTLNCKTDAFISSARFVLTDSAVAELKNLSMLKRSKKKASYG